MKNIVTTPPVDLALRILGAEETRQVHAWFDHLGNWDGDPFVRDRSHELSAIPGVRVLRTSTDTRIFFRLDGETITILDVARKQSILRTAAL